MATPDDPSNGFGDSDQQWFNRLRGKPGLVTDAEALREADALRLALQMAHEAAQTDAEVAAATTPEALQHEWQQLQFRARREGLLRSPPPKWRQQWPAVAGLAAGMALMAVLMPRPEGDDASAFDPPPTLRGESPSRQVRVPRPALSAQVFAAELRGAGLRPGIYRRAKTFIVDVDVAASELEAATPVFKRQGLAPAVGFTRVEFTAP